VSQDAPNPYAAPEADVQPTVAAASSFAPFPRFSAWWVFLLSLVTLGLYTIYWLFSRSQVLNRQLPGERIAVAFMSLAIALYAVDWFAGLAQAVQAFGSVSTLDEPVFGVVGTAISLTSWALMIAWSVMFRSRLNTLCDQEFRDMYGVNLGVTVVLALFYVAPVYLAYKINQFKDSEAS
jgi:hypothetical protein